ncbi:heme ABC transporter ATP-binding protein [Ottowia thiooxydans]|uniref:heme ABC transporter ATP-binding protein n=1 Tax=Ottowia thiooxydans TaxID=219182 RepID=UPI000406B375|nr:heme ABC transporter ATP-binding protein [Ottowia thiooxydans]
MTLQCIDARVSLNGRTLLEGASATLHPGRFTVILGPNGAGKSTLLSLLSAQRRPEAGKVLLDGQPLASMSARTLALRRAVMPQESAVAFDFTVREVVELGRYPHRQHPDANEAGIVSKALEATDVASLAPRIFNTLSGGEKARVHLARALTQVWSPRPDGAARWLLLDEPTAALDLSHQHQALGLLQDRAREDGIGVIAVLHDLNLALRYADDALLLANGEVAGFGPVAEVLTPERMAHIWGVVCTPVNNAQGLLQYLFEPASR